MTDDRIRRRVLRGELPQATADRLLKNHEAATSYRSGRVWFVFHRRTLSREPEGLWRFFEYWGGEAIYVPNQECAHLREIGAPCIVEAVMPVKSVWSAWTVGKRLVREYMHQKGFARESTESDWEGYIPDVADVRRVIAGSDLELMTGLSGWRGH